MNHRKYAASLLFATAFCVPLAFALYTRHAWEDWYITYRISKNLALGHGLVFTVGERVHGFTSPLGTLIPAAFAWLTGNDELVLWLFRLLNCVLLGITAVWLWKIARHLRLGGWAMFLMLGLFIFEAKIVDFSINGMETGLMMFFLGLALYVLIIPAEHRGVLFGLACAGLMWSRPDSFVYIAGLTIGFLLFSPAGPRRQVLGQFVQAGVVAAVLYVPWLIWAWSYYGSFVPHTVIAKGLTHAPLSETLSQALIFPLTGLVRAMSFDKLLMPSWAVEIGGWPTVLQIASRVLTWPCAFAWVLPRVRPVTRAVSFAALMANAYLNFAVTMKFPWYLPSATLLSIVVLALLFQQVADFAPRFTCLLRPAAVVVVAGAFGLTLAAAYQLRIQQMVIEEGTRKQVGLWLRDHAVAPTDRVFVETLGYIGFYSNLKMYDDPGLVSPEVVAARRALGNDLYADIINHLRPEWVVLRPFEFRGILQSKPELLYGVYAPVKTFDSSAKVDSYRFLPGRPYLQYDQTFIVLKRRDWPGRGMD